MRLTDTQVEILESLTPKRFTELHDLASDVDKEPGPTARSVKSLVAKGLAVESAKGGSFKRTPAGNAEVKTRMNN